MSRLIDADELANKVADLYTEGDNATEGDKVVNDVLDLIDKAPTVEYPEQITVECDTEEDKQKLLSALRNVKLKAVVEDERPQGKWILIAERLPDYMEDTLVTIQVNNREPKVRSGFYAHGYFHNDNGDTWNWNDPEVKAWMPLPEAYKETDNDE